MYLVFTARLLLSLQAQELRTPITTMDTLLKSNHRLYIFCDEVSFLLMLGMF
jgi:GNAT acetyltransferase, Mec-17